MKYIFKGQGSSDNALRAEERGLHPLTRAVPKLAKLMGITQKEAREKLKGEIADEWHHTGKYGRRTDFYDVYRIAGESRPAAKAAWYIAGSAGWYYGKCRKCGEEGNVAPERNMVPPPDCDCQE